MASTTGNFRNSLPLENASRLSLPVPGPVKQSSGPGLRLSPIDDSQRYRVMIKWLHRKVASHHWLPHVSPDAEYSSGGVLMRQARGHYVTEPEEIDPILLSVVGKINAEVAFTMVTETTKAIFSSLRQTQTDLLLPRGSQLQVVESLQEIVRTGRIRKFQYAALVRQEQLLLVWHDDLDKILAHATGVEEKLLALIWGSGQSPFATHQPSTPYSSNRVSATTSPTPSIYANPVEPLPKIPDESTQQLSETSSDEEKAAPAESLARPIVLTSNIFVGLAIFFILSMLLGFGVSNLIFEFFIDHYFPRIALAATIPIFFALSMFFAIVIFTDLFQAIGPIWNLKSNSRYFSAIRPNLSQAYSMGFTPPHITIQMPVYKESLENVIIPTVTSLKAAISHYESHGGSASIFVNDDGIAYLSDKDVEARIDFYHDNNIGWVSRPANNENGYIRKGKFKKASNLNFALNFSCKVELLLQQMVNEKEREKHEMNALEEDILYAEALQTALAEDTRVKAGGLVRIGEHILLVDSDTRVPEDCLLYGAAELFLSPEVAIVQHSTGVMQVAHDYFENGITFFTNLIYSSIRFAVGNGETAAFVGHNAFLNWGALQSVSVLDPDGYTAFWSECHVSEDFDVALRVQIAGHVVRMAAYHDDEFKEGVSLTIYDELDRWEKYAYGCNELVFNPIYTWLWRGPFTKLFYKFLLSNMQLSSKITIFAYISSYYALAAGLPFTIANYFLIGWLNGHLAKFYLESWQVFLSLILVFSVTGNITLAVMRYRLGQKPLLAAMAENFKWMPMMAIFFGGLPFHLIMAILSHMFGFNKQWGATSKEVQRSNFFKEVPKIFRRFWLMYVVFVVPMTGATVYLGCFAPRGWEIRSVAAVVPMSVCLVCHAILPFVLNPSIMVFNY